MNMHVRAVHHDVVGPCLQPDQHKRQNRQSHLQPLGAFLLSGLLAEAPFSRRLRPQVSDPRQHKKIHSRAHRCHRQHRNANCVLMEPANRGIENGPGQCKSREPDGKPDAADGQNGRTDALQHSHNQASAVQDLHSLRVIQPPSRARSTVSVASGQNQGSASSEVVPIRKSVRSVPITV